MSKLLAIIDDYKDKHGQPSDASISRALGIAPQTLSSWRKRGIRELPARDTLVELARFMRVPYDDVLRAVLVDVGYMEDPDQGQGDWGVRGA